MRLQDLEILEEIGLTAYERKALAALMDHGMADADALCKTGEVPSSKIYLAMEKLAHLGLAEIQPTRPRLYKAFSGDEVTDRLIAISTQKAERFAHRAEKLRKVLSDQRERIRGKKTFVDLALGIDSHVKRHLTHLTTAKKRIWSYLEQGDVSAIVKLTDGGFPIFRRVARNTSQNHIDHRIVFGFTRQAAPRLMGFLRTNKQDLEQTTGIRYSGELGHPFHVVDDDLVILALDHPFIPDGRFASLLVRDAELAERLAQGFQSLWSKAMKSLREVDFDPRT